MMDKAWIKKSLKALTEVGRVKGEDMKINKLVLLLIVSLLLITQNAFAETSPAAHNESEVTAKAESHFNTAHESFLKKDMKVAAEETRKAVHVLKDEVSHASSGGKKLLEKSAKELEELAGDLEKGTVSSEERLKEVFSNARNAISKHHEKKEVSAEKKEANKS